MVRVDTEFHLEYLTRYLVSNHVLFFYHKNIKKAFAEKKSRLPLKRKLQVSKFSSHSPRKISTNDPGLRTADAINLRHSGFKLI